MIERINPVGCVGLAGCVVGERSQTGRGVEAAGGVATERIRTGGGVAAASGIG